MPEENQTSDSSTDTTGTVEQQNQNGQDNAGSGETPPAEQGQTQQQATDATSDQGTSSTDQQQEQKDRDASKESLLSDLHKERNQRKTLSAQVEQLKAQIAQSTQATEQLTAVQRKYDRLEAFATAIGLGKALDSKSFTTALFETDEDISEIVKKWNQENPSATSVALGSESAVTADGKTDMNKLIRAAAS